MIGSNHIECVVEFSRTKLHFYIMAWDIFFNKYHVIEMHRQQANKMLKACDSDLERIMKMLDFKLNKMVIRHFEILMSFERFMPSKARGMLSNRQLNKGESNNITVTTLKKNKKVPVLLPKGKTVPRFTHCSGM